MRKFYCLLAAALATAGAAAQRAPGLAAAVAELTRAQVEAPAPGAAAEAAAAAVQPAEAMAASVEAAVRAGSRSFSLADAKPAPLEAAALDEPMFKATAAASVAAPRLAPSRAGATVKTGTLFTKDVNYKGATYSSRLALDAADADGDGVADPNAYTVTNIYGLGTTVNATIDPEAGTITIPCQTVYTVSAGDIKICPMTISDASLSYSQGDIVGAIDANGVVTLPAWGLIITEGDYKGNGYNFFTSSVWTPANATVTAYDLVNEADVSYSCLIEQTADNALTFHGLSGVTAETINARLTSTKSVLVPNSYVYNNSYYGDFYIFPYDTATGKAVEGANLVGNGASGATIDFDAWAIASRQYPTLYVGYKYSNVKVTPAVEVAWPAAPVLDLAGTGTAADPYVITTVAHHQALAALVADGNDYAGACFKLGADLDFSSVAAASYQPVGESESAPFNGTFDGDGHTVSGLTVSSYSFANLGLFGYLGANATVKNLNITSFKLSSNGSNVGALAGWCCATVDNVNVSNTTIVANCELAGGIAGALVNSSVANCHFYGMMQGNGSLAGIAGQASYATIANCHSHLIVYHTGYYSSACRDAAGIAGATSYTTVGGCTAEGVIQDNAGYAASGGLIGRCLTQTDLNSSTSAMVIYATANSTMGGSSPTNCYQGGLVGFISAAKEVRNCTSSSYVLQSSQVGASYAGGLVGYLGVGYSFSSTSGNSMKDLTHFYNCLFTGQVYAATTAAHNNIYGTTFHSSTWDGDLPEDIAFHDCYYDGQVAINADDADGWAQPTSFFTAALPTGYDAAVWTAAAGSYPMIAATAAQQAAQLAAAPLTLAAGQRSTKVSKPFSIAPADAVAWGISTDDGIVQESDALAIAGSTVSIKDQYANAAMVAYTADGWGMKLYRLSIVPKWFDGEGTAADPYQLRTAADFVKLDTAVGAYAQPHVGDFFQVMNDIDFAESDFKGIGYGKGSGYMFGGTLDGDGHTLHNLNVNSVVLEEGAVASTSTPYVGLVCFVHPLGAVKNLVVAADCSFTGTSYVGSIAAVNYGAIDACRNYAPTTAYSSYGGGIAGASLQSEYNAEALTASITGCYNAGAVVGASSCYGGIAGYNAGSIALCQNDGSISGAALTEGSTAKQNSVGGIAGSNYGSIDRSVNNAAVTARYAVGGIAGANAGASVTRSVNSGYVDCLDQEARRGGIIGQLSSKDVVEANYYDASINVNGGVNNAAATGVNALSTAAATAGTPLDGLAADDFDFAAGKYPVLKAFASEAATVALRSMAIFFADGQSRANVQAAAPLSADTEWTLAVGTSFTIADNVLTPKLPEDLSVVNDTITAARAGMVKVLPLAIIPTILSGEGTEASPYLIETPADWNTLADFMSTNKYEYVGEHFRITADLDFQNDSIRLLGVDGVKFCGILDGNGKTVKNYLYGNANSTVTAKSGPNPYMGKNIGLIGTLGGEGVVKDLTASGSFGAVSAIGGIAGEVYGTLLNCTHAGAIANTSGSSCSGIAHKVFDGGQIINCVNNGTVNSKTTYASGIVNTVAAGGLVEGCVNNGNVTSGTTGANGIAYSVAGTLRNCANHGALAGTGTAAGICQSMDNTAKLEYCYNDADILYGTTGGTIAGVTNGTKDQTGADLADHTSWLKGCYNTGNLSGKSNVYGVAANIKKGMLVADCYNTGSVTTATTYSAYGFCGSITSNNAEGLLPTTVLRCYNAGDVTSETATTNAASGFCKDMAAGCTIADCYNLGDVTVNNRATSSSAICCATGFAGKISGGTVQRCWNAGNVSGPTPCSGGLAGYVAGTDCTLVEECFNLGNVSGSSQYLKSGELTDGSTNGTAGGLFGYISTGNPVVRNCYNAGQVSGDKRVGGISGGMFKTSINAQITNCYNSGKVVCDNSWWNATIYHADYDGVDLFANSSNLYFDADINPDGDYQTSRNFPGSAKTTAEMAALNLSDAFTSGQGYPALASMSEAAQAALEASRVSTAMVAVAATDAYSNINGPITLIAADGVTWSATGEGKLDIAGSIATPTALGAVTLTASNADGTATRSFSLVINSIVSSGIDDLLAAGRTVVKALYVDPAGRIVAAPVAGQTCIVKLTFDDGTTAVRKILAR